MSKEMFRAWEEWWALVGSNLLGEAIRKTGGGCECDAFAAGAEWMRGRCEAIAKQNEVAMHAAVEDSPIAEMYKGAAVASSEIRKRIEALGGAQ